MGEGAVEAEAQTLVGVLLLERTRRLDKPRQRRFEMQITRLMRASGLSAWQTQGGLGGWSI